MTADLDRAATDALAAALHGPMPESWRTEREEMAAAVLDAFRESPVLQAWAIRAAGGEPCGSVPFPDCPRSCRDASHADPLYRFPSAVCDALTAAEREGL